MDWKGRKKIFKKKIESKDFSDLLRLIKRRLFISFILQPIGFPFALFLIPFLYLIDPLKKIRIGVIPSKRIGHLALNTEFFLRRRQLGRVDDINTIYLFLLNQGEVANQQLIKMFKRNLIIIENGIFFWIYFSIDWWLCRTRFKINLYMKDNEDFEFKNSETSLILTEEDNTKGEQLLKKLGIDPGKDWFVCIHSRDKAYLEKKYSNVNWSYHDYRDSDIDDFTEAIKFIISQGGYVIRMGSVVEKPLSFKHKNVIDYAINHRSDFMDIYLIAKCKFFLGTTGGICDVAIAMNKPRVSVNFVPLGIALFGKDCLYIPKKVKKNINGKYLSLSEVLQKGWDRIGIEYNGLSYKYEDNSQQEILEITKEMIERLDGVFRMSKEDEILLERYFDLFQPENFSYKVRNPVGLHFLKNNPEVFFSVQELEQNRKK